MSQSPIVRETIRARPTDTNSFRIVTQERRSARSRLEFASEAGDQPAGDLARFEAVDTGADLVEGDLGVRRGDLT